MATQTPLIHPAQMAQTEQFYLYRATFTRLDDDGEPVPVDSVEPERPCAYQPAGGGAVVGFQDQDVTKDRLLIPGWYPQIGTKWEISLTLARDGSEFGRFRTDDVMPNDSSQSATLLTVSPV